MVFAVLAFFVFGQAAVVRSDAQGAADAAALAAAREARDHLNPALDLAELQPRDWEAILEGRSFDWPRACAAAEEFARRNDAGAACTRAALRFTVEATTDRTVGDSVVPGTGGMHARAKAVAEIIPRCTLGSLPTPSGAPTGTPSPGPSPPPGPVVIDCRGETVRFDPLDPGRWRTLARSLFDVRLAG
ncbi:hypothetical protein CP968_12615 [Streptomyces subrutilus]|nr:hypothetical protein CP968_12615 [Streptomyces subrutilus]